MEAYLGVGGEAEHGCIEEGEEIVMRLTSLALGLGVLQRHPLKAQFSDNPPQEGRGILQIAQHLDERLVV